MNDKALRQNVIDELDFEPSIDAANIGVLGGVITAPLLTVLVIPAANLLLRRRSLPRHVAKNPASPGSPVTRRG